VFTGHLNQETKRSIVKKTKYIKKLKKVPVVNHRRDDECLDFGKLAEKVLLEF
jgi:hypothetical protein